MQELPVAQARYSPLKTLILYLTEDCNLRCTYCFVKKTPRTMTRDTARKAVDFAFHRNISGVERAINLNFFGGEPFLHLGLMDETARYASEAAKEQRKSVEFAATTNATLANSEAERVISDHRVSLLLSVDGGESAMKFRPFLGGGSPYRAVRRNLKRLVQWSPRVVARMTYHPEALSLRSNVEKVLELGAPSVALCAVHESDWRGYEDQLEQAFQDLANWFIAEALRGSFLPLEVTWQQLRALYRADLGGSRPARPCEVGTSLMAIDPDGAVMPCHRYLYRPQDWLGRVETPEHSSRREQYVRLSSRGILGCDSCVANSVCGGGCRYLVVSEGGDLASGTHSGYCLNTQIRARASQRIYQTLMERIPHEFSGALRSSKPLSESFGEVVL